MSDPTETARRVLDLDKQATQGPWRWDPKRGTYEYNAQNVGGFVAGGAAVCHFGNSEQYYPEQGEPPNEADRALIAEYRTAAPELARALLESQAALAAAEEGRLAALDIAKGAYEERDEARAALAAALARAEAAERDWIDAKADFGQQTAAWGREIDALKADLATARTEKCDDCENYAGVRVCTGCWSKQTARAEKAESDLAAARQEVEALRAQVEALPRYEGKLLDAVPMTRDPAGRWVSRAEVIAALSAAPAPTPADTKEDDRG